MNIENLEPRIAPASLTFSNVDGDAGTITAAGDLGPVKVGGDVCRFAGRGTDVFALRNPLGATFASDGTSDFYAFEIA